MGNEETVEGEGRLGVAQAEEPISNFHVALCLIEENSNFALDNYDVLVRLQRLGTTAYHLLSDLGQTPECPYEWTIREFRTLLALYDPTHIQHLEAEPNRTIAELLRNPEIPFNEKADGYFGFVEDGMKRLYLKHSGEIDPERQKYWNRFFGLNGNGGQIE